MGIIFSEVFSEYFLLVFSSDFFLLVFSSDFFLKFLFFFEKWKNRWQMIFSKSTRTFGWCSRNLLKKFFHGSTPLLEISSKTTFSRVEKNLRRRKKPSKSVIFFIPLIIRIFLTFFRLFFGKFIWLFFGKFFWIWGFSGNFPPYDFQKSRTSRSS